MTKEEMRKAIISYVLYDCNCNEEERIEIGNYLNEQFLLADIGKILTDCLHIEFRLKGTKKEPLVNIYINGGSNSKKLILRDVPKTEEVDSMISYVSEFNFVKSIKERNKHDQ